MLRAALLVFGVALTGAGFVTALVGCGLGIALRLALPGVVLVGALIVERWRYRRLGKHDPGPGWIATDERFIDPETGRLVEVWWRPETGERRYEAPRPAGAPRAKRVSSRPGPRSSAG
ncbi:MAG TPA: hypothetical protein VGF34_09645 [Stellaceae bacterium]